MAAQTSKRLSHVTSSPTWLAVLLGAALLFALFIYASVDLIIVALESQPDCIAHERVGERLSSTTTAAKSSC